MSTFDALCEIADAILPNGGLVAVLHHFYMDESGTHDGSPVITLGGYLFSSEQARKFSRDWRKDLDHFGLPFAHMTDCALGFGPYKDLTLDQRIESEKRLITQIKRRSMFGFAISMHNSAYDSIIGGTNLPSAYSILLQLVVLKVRDIAAKRGFKGEIAYFFEAGHRFANEAHHYMNFMAGLGQEVRDYYFYAGHAFVDKRSSLPLQAADMLVWQECHFQCRSLQGHSQRRADFKALTRDVDKVSIIQPDDLLRMRARADAHAYPSHTIPQPILKALIEQGHAERPQRGG